MSVHTAIRCDSFSCLEEQFCSKLLELHNWTENSKEDWPFWAMEPILFLKLLNNNCGQDCNYGLSSEICHMKEQAIMKSTIFWARPNLEWPDLGKSNCGDPY